MHFLPLALLVTALQCKVLLEKFDPMLKKVEQITRYNTINGCFRKDKASVQQWSCKTCVGTSPLTGKLAKPASIFITRSKDGSPVDAYIAKLPNAGGATIFSFSGANSLDLKLSSGGQWTTVPYPRTPFLIRFPFPLVQETGYTVFVDWYQKYKSDIAKAVKAADGEIWITGHSLGGPLAYFLGEHLVSEFGVAKSRIVVVTVGSMRPGNRHFKDVILAALEPKNLYRVTVGNDALTRIPVTNELYAHIPTEIFIDGDKVYRCAGTSNDGEDANCNRKASANIKLIGALFSTNALHNSAFGVSYGC
jgi:hypothetical protein